MSAVDVGQHSPNLQQIPSLVDTQLLALGTVLGANVRYGLGSAPEVSKWLGEAVVDHYEFPVTLHSLSAVRLPCISVWRASTVAIKRQTRRTTFSVRYWLDSTTAEHLPFCWPALQGAYEIITQTLFGAPLVDMDAAGEPKRVPSTDLLKRAGFQFIYKETIRGESDFAADPTGESGRLYPVHTLTFDAEHSPVFGGLPYPMPDELDALEQLAFALWDGSAGATPEAPIVEGRAPRE